MRPTTVWQMRLLRMSNQETGRKTVARKDPTARGRSREDIRETTPERGTLGGARGPCGKAWSWAELSGL